MVILTLTKTSQTINFRARFLYNTFLYWFANLRIYITFFHWQVHIFLYGRFCANKAYVCLNMHCFYSINNWLHVLVTSNLWLMLTAFVYNVHLYLQIYSRICSLLYIRCISWVSYKITVYVHVTIELPEEMLLSLLDKEHHIYSKMMSILALISCWKTVVTQFC